MKTFETKSMLPNVLAAAVALFCLAFDGVLVKMLVEQKEQILQGQMTAMAIEILVVIPLMLVLFFVLLNVFPKKISVDGDSLEMTFLCGNKVSLKKEQLKVLCVDEQEDSWKAILFVCKRPVYLNSASFPELKELVCGEAQ